MRGVLFSVLSDVGLCLNYGSSLVRLFNRCVRLSSSCSDVRVVPAEDAVCYGNLPSGAYIL